MFCCELSSTTRPCVGRAHHGIAGDTHQWHDAECEKGPLLLEAIVDRRAIQGVHGGTRVSDGDALCAYGSFVSRLYYEDSAIQYTMNERS